MTERLIHSAEVASQHRETIDQVALSVVASGGNMSEIAEALSTLGINFEVARSIFYRLQSSGHLTLEPNYGLTLTEKGKARLSSLEQGSAAQRLGEVTVERRQEMRRLGKTILDQSPARD